MFLGIFEISNVTLRDKFVGSLLNVDEMYLNFMKFATIPILSYVLLFN